MTRMAGESWVTKKQRSQLHLPLSFLYYGILATEWEPYKTVTKGEDLAKGTNVGQPRALE
jgi:hypothetical protein